MSSSFKFKLCNEALFYCFSQFFRCFFANDIIEPIFQLSSIFFDARSHFIVISVIINVIRDLWKLIRAFNITNWIAITIFQIKLPLNYRIEIVAHYFLSFSDAYWCLTYQLVYSSNFKLSAREVMYKPTNNFLDSFLRPLPHSFLFPEIRASVPYTTSTLY